MKASVMRQVMILGSTAILVGVLLLLFTMYRFDQVAQSGEWVEPAAELLESLGVAAIVFGIFNIIIGLPDWSRYFEERLQNIVLDAGYLKSLSPEQLRSLQRRLIKAAFNNEALDKEGSFLEYFDRYIHSYLGRPYREKVQAVITYEADENEDLFFVHDYVSYVLREIGGRIQDRVIWNNDPDEMEKVYSVRVAVKFPEGHPEPGGTRVIHEIGEKEATAQREILVNCDLKDYRNIDGLLVQVESTYAVRKSRFQYWEMPSSTRNFSLTINHPTEYAVVFQPFVHNPELTRRESIPGRFHFESDSWMLTNSGVAWRLEPTSPVTSLQDYVTKNPIVRSTAAVAAAAANPGQEDAPCLPVPSVT